MNAERKHDAVATALVVASLLVMGWLVLPRLRPAPHTETPALPTEATLPADAPPAAAAARDVPDLAESTIRDKGLSLHEASYYTALDDKRVRCDLCPHLCQLAPGQRGVCGVRINLDGKLRSLVYGLPVALHVDPVEKKPLNHFLPGSRAFSLATAGCNLGCIFCQNWSISQALPEDAKGYRLSPEEVVALAERQRCESIAYTYTEPSVFYEYMLDCARLARKRGLKNLMITCGYINPEPLRELCKYMDAANVDLKGFSEEFYRDYCNARLKPVLETMKIMKAAGVWVEVTNLIIPDANDDPALIRRMCRWIVKELGPDTPLHFSRFFPQYRLKDRPPTPTTTLVQAKRIAEEEGLRYVFIGNVHVEGGGDTRCPKCGRVVVERLGFAIRGIHIKDGKCAFCGAPIAGVWKDDRKKP